MKPTIGVIGCGSWGKNLVRNFHELNALKAVCDINQNALQAIQDKYPTVQAVQNHRVLIQDSTIKAVVISTPAATHYALAKEALLAEKDVFVEKPIALVTGNPARLVGWVSEAGKKLTFDRKGFASCEKSGKTYKRENGAVQEVAAGPSLKNP
jgi:UDP-2-acetamido-3-amino-2,3-dideoxy-glucuronate N-acetyltransferase